MLVSANKFSVPASWLRPAWEANAELQHIGALMSSREGGVSAAPFDQMNLGSAVGDDPLAVRENRWRFALATGAKPVFLNQVHGTRVVRLTAADALANAPLLEADASVTTERGVACTVQVADCLPLLLAAPKGRAVAAAHAGWRGLAGGVLQASIQAVCELGACAPNELHAWLGPCIGPRQFEVGPDVLLGFGEDPEAAAWAHFTARGDDAVLVASTQQRKMPRKWLADLPGLATACLRSAGVQHISGGSWCTAEDRSRFFSFRRDRLTGRLAAAIWIR